LKWWIQKKWNVLPTDPRFLELTEEQMDLLQRHYLKDHPELVVERYEDPDYAAAELEGEE